MFGLGAATSRKTSPVGLSWTGCVPDVALRLFSFELLMRGWR